MVCCRQVERGLTARVQMTLRQRRPTPSCRILPCPCSSPATRTSIYAYLTSTPVRLRASPCPYWWLTVSSRTRRPVHALDACAPRRGDVFVPRCGGLPPRLGQPRLLGALLGDPRLQGVQAGEHEPPGEGARGRARRRVPSVAACHGERGRGRRRQAVCDELRVMMCITSSFPPPDCSCCCPFALRVLRLHGLRRRQCAFREHCGLEPVVPRPSMRSVPAFLYIRIYLATTFTTAIIVLLWSAHSRGTGVRLLRIHWLRLQVGFRWENIYDTL